MERHEVVCDFCGKVAPMVNVCEDWDDPSWEPPEGWVWRSKRGVEGDWCSKACASEKQTITINMEAS